MHKGGRFICLCPMYLEPLNCVNLCIMQNLYANLYVTIVKLYMLCVAFGLHFLIACIYYM
jgi:hypothetical protein